MPLPSLAMDIGALLVVVLCAIFYARRGFVAGLFSFMSTLGALLLAVFGSRWLAPIVFNNFFAPGITDGVQSAIESQGVTDVGQMVNDAMGFLPEAMRQAVLDNLGPSIPTISAADVARQVVETVVAPIVIPFITIILFFIILLLTRMVVGLIRRVAVGVARLPVISLLNSAVGAVMGVLVSVLYVYILLCFIWGYDALNPVNAIGELYFGKSFVWGLFKPLNFFAGI